MKRDNRIVVDLNKVQWARFYYKNQRGDRRDTLPPCDTINNTELSSDTKIFLKGEGFIPAAMYYNLTGAAVDIWLPQLYIKLTANEYLCYTGDKAKSIWQEWNKRIFEKKKGKKK